MIYISMRVFLAGDSTVQAYSLFIDSSNGSDHTHFNENGANVVARVVAKDLSDSSINLPKYVVWNRIIKCRD